MKALRMDLPIEDARVPFYLNVTTFLMCYQVNGDAVTTPWSTPEEPKLSVSNIDPKQNKLEVQTGKKTKINHIF